MSSFLQPTFIISILIALSVHEWAHGFMADKLGDPTARRLGRLTLNPLAHLDPFGSIMFLLVGFGWAKPVPVNPSYFRQPKRDMALVALAGPASNLILAFIAFVGIALLGASQSNSLFGLLSLGAGENIAVMFLMRLFAHSLFVNLALMAFNLLPIAPLDGSKILHLFVPLRYEDLYAQYLERGFIILIVLILAGRLFNFPLLSGWVFGISNVVLQLFGLLFPFVPTFF